MRYNAVPILRHLQLSFFACLHTLSLEEDSYGFIMSCVTLGLHGGLHQSNAESQEAQDLPDVLRVAARQVVVGCDHVDAALVLERCQEGRQQRHDGLPLTFRYQ